MRTINDSRCRRAVLPAVILMLVATAAAAQIPSELQNLQVLPKDIDKRQLIEVMKSFCSALDVRCTHCHVGDEGAPLSEVDFAADDKQHKQTTRVMMRMVDAINNTHLPRTGASDPLRVRCVTCHRGQSKPQTLEGVLAATVREEGIEAGLDKYRALRERYYGSATFDFSAGTLPHLASQLSAADNVAAAIAFLELNTELYPGEMTSYFFLGDLHAKGGDKVKAIENLEQALKLEPDNPLVKRKLEQLTGD